MGHVELSGVGYDLPDGRPLLRDVSFRVGDGAIVALVGANGSGKTTLLRIIAGDLAPTEGTISRSGGLGVMRQFIGSIRDHSTVRDLLFSLSPPRIREAAAAVDALELRLMDDDTEPVQLAYVNPETGGFAQNILGFYALMLRPGQVLKLPVRSPAMVFHQIEGRITVDAEGQTFALGEADTCCIPGYTAVTLANASAEQPAYVFIADETPLHKKLGVYEVRG